MSSSSSMTAQVTIRQRLSKNMPGKDPRIRCAFHERNRGVSAARNTALGMVKGEWVTVIYSDDAWHPKRLERLIALTEEGFFVADDLILCFDKEGVLLPWKRYLSAYGIRFPKSGLLEMDLVDYLKKGCPGLNPMFPFLVVITHRLEYTENCQLGEDVEFLCHLLRVGLKLRLTGEPLYFLRLTHDSLTAKRNMLRNYDHLLGVYDRLLAHPGFREEEKHLLSALRLKAIKQRNYILFTKNLEEGNYGEAIRILRKRPYVLVQLIRGLPRSVAYRVSAKVKGGSIKS